MKQTFKINCEIILTVDDAKVPQDQLGLFLGRMVEHVADRSLKGIGKLEVTNIERLETIE